MHKVNRDAELLLHICLHIFSTFFQERDQNITQLTESVQCAKKVAQKCFFERYLLIAVCYVTVFISEAAELSKQQQSEPAKSMTIIY